MLDEITGITQKDLLARIRSDCASFASFWRNLTDEQTIHRSGYQDDWSVKD